MTMSLVNQSYLFRLIAILLQSTLYKPKIEDLVTIGNRLFFSIFIHGSLTSTYSIGKVDPIRNSKKFCFVIS